MTHAPASPSVTVGPHGLRLDGEELPFLSGAMHYFRVPHGAWGRCLDAIVELGLPLVESYVPWSVHEREEGRLDFGDGPVVDGFERDLDGFLDACAERGLRVLLRPGPGVNAELTGFGYPARILRDERCLAVGNRGNRVILPTPPRCFAVPSYASERFLEQAGVWLRGFGDHVRPRLWPDGPVVGAQVDNELSLFFRCGAYDQDYHPDAVDRYREFLTRRYPDGLPPVYGDGPAEPPRRFAADSPQQLLRQLDWVAFKEHLVLRALDRLARVLRMVGLDRVVLFHNFPAGWTGAPCGLPVVEQALDMVGLDVHLRPQDLGAVRRAALGLAAARLPVALELACGTWPWWFPQRWPDQRAVALTLLMHGAKGFNLYMAVDRDRWYGAPIGADGQRREHFGEIQRLVAATKAAVSLDRSVPVAVLRVHEYERLTVASSLADPFPPLALDLLGVGPAEVCSVETAGLEGPVGLEYSGALAAVAATLDRAGVAYHTVGSDLPAERLARYRVAVVPLFDFVDTGLLERLEAFVEDGGALLLVGRLPRLDGQMGPLERPIPPHRLVDPASELEAALAAALGRVPTGPRASADGVEVTVHGDPTGPRVVYVANRTDGFQTTEVALEGVPDLDVRDALLGQPVDLRCIRLAPGEVRMLRVTPAAQSNGGAP